MEISFALIALAVGYKVFIEACKENNSARRSFGRMIGVFIMTVSMVLSTAPVLKYACTAAGNPGSCPLSRTCPLR